MPGASQITRITREALQQGVHLRAQTNVSHVQDSSAAVFFLDLQWSDSAAALKSTRCPSVGQPIIDFLISIKLHALQAVASRSKQIRLLWILQLFSASLLFLRRCSEVAQRTVQAGQRSLQPSSTTAAGARHPGPPAVKMGGTWLFAAPHPRSPPHAQRQPAGIQEEGERLIAPPLTHPPCWI